MKPLLPFALSAILLSGCTIEQKNGELQSEFHPPLAYAQWNTEQYKTVDGQPVCAISSGYNGLTVLLRGKGDGFGVSVKSERPLRPGMELSVNAGGNHYATSQEFFSSEEAPKLAADLAAGGKAYVEWRERHPGHSGWLRSSNILKLEDFAPLYAECQRILKGGKS